MVEDVFNPSVSEAYELARREEGCTEGKTGTRLTIGVPGGSYKPLLEDMENR